MMTKVFDGPAREVVVIAPASEGLVKAFQSDCERRGRREKEKGTKQACIESANARRPTI